MKLFFNNGIIFLSIFFLFSCSSPKGLKHDETQREKMLSSYKVAYYRIVKLLLRAPAGKIDDPEFKKLKDVLPNKSEAFKFNLATLRQIYFLKNAFLTIDEDSFPSLMQDMVWTYQLIHNVQAPPDDLIRFLTNSNLEHLLLGAFWYLNVVQLNAPEFGLYELSKVRNDSLPCIEMSLIHKLLVPYVYLDQNWHFLSIQSADEAIEFLDVNKGLLQNSDWLKESPFTLKASNPLYTWHQFRAIAFLNKGVAAYSVDRALALSSFELFLKEAEQGRLPLEPELLREIQGWVKEEKSFNIKSALKLLNRLVLKSYEASLKTEALQGMLKIQEEIGWDNMLESLKSIQKFDWKSQSNSYFQKTTDYIKAFF